MNGPDRNVVVHDPLQGFPWNAVPIGTGAWHELRGWPCREQLVVEPGKVDQQFRPGHRDHGIKQVPIPLNTDAAIWSTLVKVLIEETY